MSSALALLFRLRLRGYLRRLVRGGSYKRLVGAALGLVMVCVWVLPGIVASVSGVRADPERVRLVLPLMLLAFALLPLIITGGARPIVFMPAEVDFLFPAPFTRRQLLLYKVGVSLTAALITGFFFSLWLLRYSSFWLASYASCVLMLMLTQMLNMLVGMLRLRVEEGSSPRVRRLITGALLVAAAAVVWTAWGRYQASEASLTLVSVARDLRAIPGAAWLLAPLEPFARAFTAESLPELARWGGAALAIVLALLLLALGLDTNYLEAASVQSRKIYDNIRRARRGQYWTAATSARFGLPALPWLLGCGPFMWRQFTGLVRGLRGLLVMTVVSGFFVAMMLLSARPEAAEGPRAMAGLSLAVSAGVWLSIMLAMSLRYDFRGDLDQMDWIKSLPVPPWAIFVGQLAAPVLTISALQLVILGVTGWHVGWHPTMCWVAVAIPPVNFVMLALENVVFLLYPNRTGQAGAADLQHLGRQAMLLFGRLLVMLVFAVGIAVVAVPVYFLSGRSAEWTIAAGWLVLCAIGAAMVRAGVWALRSFDVSRDMPD
ncbi:MAG: hypothetical protein JNM07_01495 [Phycisphaerae bacterium]|nr:hypothetical protein [Phycisphaerae bacterium]